MTDLERLKAERDAAFAAYNAARDAPWNATRDTYCAARAAYYAARAAYEAARDTYYAALAAQPKEPTDD